MEIHITLSYSEKQHPCYRRIKNTDCEVVTASVLGYNLTIPEVNTDGWVSLGVSPH